MSFTSTVSTTSTASGTATVINLSGQGDLDAIFDAISQGEDLSKLVGDLLHTDVSDGVVCGFLLYVVFFSRYVASATYV